MHLYIDDELEDDVGAFLLPPHMLKHVELLRQAPFLFPFVERVKFFNSLVMLDRRQVQGQYQAFLQGRSFNITIRREHVYEDAFAELAKGIGTSAYACMYLMQCDVGPVCVHKELLSTCLNLV